MTLRSATQLICNSEFSRQETIKNTGVYSSKVKTIYHGVEDCCEKFTPKEALVVTAGNVDHTNLQRKGLEPFVRAAALLPDIPFVLIGRWQDNAIHHLRSAAPSNVRFTGWVSDEQLYSYFARARVYLQASRHEGFGLSVAEAMLCRCIPVTTRAGALPEVTGDAGVYLNSQEPNAIADGIRRAFASDYELGQRARERILLNFPVAKRKLQLFDLIDLHIDKGAL